ncbi:hypothetical protein [Neisseria chenwenguii]|uniref:hypothetical protein n=1 Tax=Neisseria chenwenguii TaxID=1853278 RepID=UPI0038CDAE0A
MRSVPLVAEGITAHFFQDEHLPAATHPMDVIRTGVSALSFYTMPESEAREIADKLISILGSIMLY